MAEYLESYSSKSANADELAEVGSHCDTTRQNYEHLQTQQCREL